MGLSRQRTPLENSHPSHPGYVLSKSTAGPHSIVMLSVPTGLSPQSWDIESRRDIESRDIERSRSRCTSASSAQDGRQTIGLKEPKYLVAMVIEEETASSSR